MLPYSFVKRVSPSLIRVALLSTCLAALAASAAGQTLLPQELNLPDVRGGTFQAANKHSGLVLVAFLSVMSERADSPSLRQSLILSSMQRQYAQKGLSVVAVDTSSLLVHRSIARQDIARVATNWHMDFPVLDGTNGMLLGRFGRTDDSPTLLLINDSGRIVHIWHGFTRPAYLAQAIERELGGPLSRIPDLPPSTR
jgi:hypothetical protein